MHHARTHVVAHAWDDYEMGYCMRREAEAVELSMIESQRQERELLTGTTVIVDCFRCGAQIDVPALVYRGDNRHACVDCSAGHGWPFAPSVDEDDERGGRR